MLAITPRGTQVSIVFMEDCEPNDKGWLCEVYRYNRYGELENELYDDFSISPEYFGQEMKDEYGNPSEIAENLARYHIECEVGY